MSEESEETKNTVWLIRKCLSILISDFFEEKERLPSIVELDSMFKKFFDEMMDKEVLQDYKVNTTTVSWKETYPRFWDRVRAYVGLNIFNIRNVLYTVTWYASLFPYSLSSKKEDGGGDECVSEPVLILRNPSRTVHTNINAVFPQQFPKITFVLTIDGVEGVVR